MSAKLKEAIAAQSVPASFSASLFNGIPDAVYQVTPGTTINEWLDESGMRKMLHQVAVTVRLNGREIMEAEYDHVLTEKDTLELQQLPQSGVEVATIIQWVYYAVVVVSAIHVLTMPEPGMPETADVKEGSPTYTLSARGNRYRPDRKGPVLYGKLRIVPDFDQLPFSTFDANNDQTLHMMFRITQGEANVDVNSIRFEDTPLAAFSGVQTEVIPPGQVPTLFPVGVVESQDVSNLELTSSYTPAYVVSPVGDDVTRIALDISSPRIFRQDKQSGDMSRYTVRMLAEYQEIDASDQPVGDWMELGRPSLSSSNNDPLRRTFEYTVPPGRYQVRLRRTTFKNDSMYVQDTVTWMALKGFLYDADDTSICTRLAISVRASEQIGNKALTDMSVIATRKLPTWNVQTGWSGAVATQSIAWALADLCRASYAGNRADTHYDLPKLAQLDAQLTPKEHYFNAYFDTEGVTVWDALIKAGTPGRITPIDKAGFYTFVRDEFQSQSKQTFTMHDIVRGSFSIQHAGVLEETADSIIVKFQDEDNDYRQREILCALPDSPAQTPREINLFGVTNAVRAKELGMFLAASNRYRRKRTPFETGMEGRIPFYGSKIAISHWMLGAEGKPQVSGEIKSYDGTNKLWLSEKIADKGYENPHIVMVDLNGEPMPAFPVTVLDDFVVQVNNSPEGDAPDWSQVALDPSYRRRFILGEGTQYITESKVTKIERNGDTIRFEAFVDDIRVYQYGDNVEPPPSVDLPAPPTAAPILTELTAHVGGTTEAPVVTLDWSLQNADRTDIEVSEDGGDTWEPLGKGFTLESQYEDRPAPGQYVYRVAAVNLFRGEWVSIQVDTGDAAFSRPLPVENLALREPFIGPVLKLQWDSGTYRHLVEVVHNGSVKFFETIEGETWDFAGSDAVANGIGRSFTVRVWAVADNGKTSETAAELAVSNPAPAVLNNLIVTSLLGQAKISFTWPPDPDIEGISVWRGPATGFAVGPATLVVDRSRDPVIGVPVEEGETTFIRVAAVDAWGETGLNVSGEYQVTGKTVDLTQVEEDLAELETTLGTLSSDLDTAEQNLSGLSQKFPIQGTDISDGAVATEKLAANAVTAAKIDALAVTTAKLAALAVSAEKIAASAVSADKIAANAVTAEKIAALAVTAAKIAANAVTADKIDVAQLSAIAADLGTVTAGTVKTTDGTTPRVEISSSGSFPIWMGNGSKTTGNGKFYFDTSGNAYFKGTLSISNTVNGIRTEIDNNGVRVYEGTQLRARFGRW